jgi:hypothetical protein
MAYVNPNCRTKKELKERLARGEKVEVFQPGLGEVPSNGVVYLEGPHYPEPHRWYAQGEMRDGVLVKVK